MVNGSFSDPYALLNPDPKHWLIYPACVLRRPDKRPMVKDGSDYEWETWKRSARQIGLLGTAISCSDVQISREVV
jgi:hypothetical protein